MEATYKEKEVQVSLACVSAMRSEPLEFLSPEEIGVLLGRGLGSIQINWCNWQLQDLQSRNPKGFLAPQIARILKE